MIIYKRDIGRKLLSLRILLFILGTVCFLAFHYQYNNLGYFIAVVLILLSIIVVKNFIVFQDSFQISKYYFFGLIRFRWKFNLEEKFKILSLGADFGGEGDVLNTEPDAAGCLLLVLSVFFPSGSGVIKKEFRIERSGKVNTPFSRVHIFLDRVEFNYLQGFYTDTKPTTIHDF